jgi:hypothetical protein
MICHIWLDRRNGSVSARPTDPAAASAYGVIVEPNTSVRLLRFSVWTKNDLK